MQSWLQNSGILLAEDDDNDVFLLRRAVQEVGIGNPLHLVRDGREAIDYLSGKGKFADRSRYPIPCLVLLDVAMPLMTGLETLRWIRQQPEFRTLIVIIFTGSALQQDVDAAYQFGANSFLVKPSDHRRLIELVRALKVYWLENSPTPSFCKPAHVEHP